MVLLDLFSGIGGFHKGLEQAGFKFKKVYFSEIEKHAIANYKYNYPNAQYIGSVESILNTRIERPNIITFGSPCQDFSLAGKREGIVGKRSSLIEHALSAIHKFKPNIFIWENVKGAFSTNNSEDFWAIIQAFANIRGYRCEWQLLNSSFVLPQNRERIYFIGRIANKCRGQIFPITKSNRLYHKSSSIREVQRNCMTITKQSMNNLSGTYLKDKIKIIGGTQKNASVSFNICPTLTNAMGKGGRHIPLIKKENKIIQLNKSKEFGKQPKQQNRVYSEKGISPTLTNAMGKGGNQVPYIKKENKIPVKSGIKRGYEEATEGDCIDLSFKNNDNKRGKVGKGVSTTLDRKCNKGVVIKNTEDLVSQQEYKQKGIYENFCIRKLTEIECERLQGFPDNWTQYGIYDSETKKISMTNRYSLIGNAVTVKIVEMIAKIIIENTILDINTQEPDK